MFCTICRRALLYNRWCVNWLHIVQTSKVHIFFRSLAELDGLRLTGEAGDKIRQVTERATLFRITSNAMINVSLTFFFSMLTSAFLIYNVYTPEKSLQKVFQCYAPQACRDFLTLAQNHSKRWQKALQAERDQRVRLEETLEQLAKQHNHLERAFRGAAQANASPDNKGKLWPWQDYNEGLMHMSTRFYKSVSHCFPVFIVIPALIL